MTLLMKTRCQSPKNAFKGLKSCFLEKEYKITVSKPYSILFGFRTKFTFYEKEKSET